MFGDDGVGGDRRDRTISQPRSVVQLRRAGAAGAGVGGEGGAVRDHAAGLAVAALDDGGSGAGGDAQFAGGAALL